MGRKKVPTVKKTVRKPRTVKETVTGSEETENKTFQILTDKLWFIEKDQIKIGESMSDFMSGDLTNLDVKEILVGENFKTWTLVIGSDDNFYLLKTSKKL